MYAGAKIFTVWKSKIYFLLIFNFDIFLRAGGVYDSKTQKTVTKSPHRSFREKRRNNTVRTACRLACQACLALLVVSVKGEHGTAQRPGGWTTRIWKKRVQENFNRRRRCFHPSTRHTESHLRPCVAGTARPLSSLTGAPFYQQIRRWHAQHRG